MKEKRKHAIGVDVGGSHISSAIIDLEHFELIENSYFSQKINNKASKDHILKGWASVINKTRNSFSKGGPSGIAFAMPGPFNYPEGIAKFEGNNKYENLFNVHVRQELKQYLDSWVGKINFYNDACCFAVGAAEKKHVGRKAAVGITLGTGFGAAFIEDGIPLMEGPRVPENGCLWHLPYKKGIADDYFSTRWFLSEFQKRTGMEPIGVREMIETDRETCVEIFAEFSENLSAFLLPHLTNFNTETLLIGGNIAKAEKLFLPDLRKNLRQNNFQIQILEETEKHNILGSSKLMISNFWGTKKKSTSYFYTL